MQNKLDQTMFDEDRLGYNYPLEAVLCVHSGIAVDNEHQNSNKDSHE